MDDWPGIARLFKLYERSTPATVRSLLRPFFSDARSLRWFLFYACIGATGVGIYLVLVWFLTLLGVAVLVASGVAFACGATAQFLLNRNLNFRAFHRAAHDQARMYIAVMAINFVLTLAIVSVCKSIFHMGALLSNLLTLPVTFPVAYLTNRYRTFA